MLQRLALKVNKRPLPRRMHHLEYERAPIRASQMEIVVVLPWKPPRRRLHTVEFPRQAHRFRFRRWLSYARLQQHAPNLIRKCRSASNPERSNNTPEPPLHLESSPLTGFLLSLAPKPAHSPWKAGSSPASFQIR